ncbi:DUF4398 domain-containing protein [Pseudomonas syringae]|uniref:DUF4398 domain-containing protein n=1 Tax=Pseudomonas syringae TaxID=317 RepID=UPI003F74BC4A
MSIRFSIAVTAIATLVGCASDPVPTEQFKLTEQALQQAKAVGAADDQPEMETALSSFAEARAAMAAHSYKQARMSAERTELDARLAEARVLTVKSQEQVNQLNTRLNRLRKQLGEAQ